MTRKHVSIKNLLIRFKWRISLTLALVVLESVLELLFPLIIGFAINDLIEKSFSGIVHLGLLGAFLLIIGGARRFYDTRIYASIYCTISKETVSREQELNSSVSKISARADLLNEFVGFLENSFPEICSNLIGLVGILIIIFSLNVNVFAVSMGLLVLMLTVYAMTGKLNFRMNKNFNDQMEKQVTLLETGDPEIIGTHFKRLMHWNIKLSDLETFNYLAVYVGIIGLLIVAPVTIVQGGDLKYGLVFSILMYVLQYIEGVAVFPLYIQELIRLQEITYRLNNNEKIKV